MSQKTRIVFWSGVSGFVLGGIAGVGLLVLLLLGARILPPEPGARLAGLLRLPVLILCLFVLPAIGAILGALEGRIKLR